MNDMPLPTAYFASNRSKDVNVNIESFDVDFTNSIDDRNSISGYAFMLAGGPQATVALSTMKAEYMAAAYCSMYTIVCLSILRNSAVLL